LEFTLAWRPFLPGLQSTTAAYAWSLGSLIPLAAIALAQSPSAKFDDGKEDSSLFGFSAALLIAFVVSLIYGLGARIRIYGETRRLALHWQNIEVAFWSFISHAALAIAAVSALNLIFLLARKSTRPQSVRRGLVGAFIALVLSVVLARFLGGAMSFDGWAAYVYATVFALSLTLWGFWLVEPFLGRKSTSTASDQDAKLSLGQGVRDMDRDRDHHLARAGFALADRREDWNGFVEGTAALLFWIVMSICVYRLRPVRANYSVPVVVGALLVSAFVYKGTPGNRDFLG